MRIILIGNAPLTEDISHLIHENDYIVRFNLPSNLSIKLTGGSTNSIFLANTDYLAKKNIMSGLLLSSIFKDQPRIILPYHKEVILRNFPSYKVKLWSFIKYKKSNYNTEWFINQLKQTNCEIETLTPNAYKECLDLLKIEDIPIANRITKKAYIPSTGLIALNYYLCHPTFKNIPIMMHGFSFIGWDGHAWDMEKAYVAALYKQRKVSFFDDTILR